MRWVGLSGKCRNYIVHSIKRSYPSDIHMSFSQRLKDFRFIRKLVYAIVGLVSYPGLMIVNRLRITVRNICGGCRKGMFFSSAITRRISRMSLRFLHIFCAVKWGKRDRLGLPYYLLNPFTNVYYVAAEETMRATWVSRLFTMAGALTVRRTWNQESKEVRKGLDPSDTRKITRALERSWVITFPQGTTKAFAPGPKRYGAYHQAKQADRRSGGDRRILACL